MLKQVSTDLGLAKYFNLEVESKGEVLLNCPNSSFTLIALVTQTQNENT